MAVVVEVANQWDIYSHSIKLLPNVRHRFCGLRRIDGEAHHFRACQCQLLHLNRCANDINSVGIGHGLNTHRRIATDRNHPSAPDHGRLAGAPRFGCRRINR